MKNCPFCTEPGDMLDLVVLPDSMGRANIRKGMVRCKNCGAQGPETWAEFTEIESTAVFAWDDRPGMITRVIAPSIRPLPPAPWWIVWASVAVIIGSIAIVVQVLR